MSIGMVKAVNERLNSATVCHFCSLVITIIIENKTQAAMVIRMTSSDTIIDETMVVTNNSSDF